MSERPVVHLMIQAARMLKEIIPLLDVDEALHAKVLDTARDALLDRVQNRHEAAR